MRRLDPMQVELGGTLLIEASAGTGKTHAITSLVLRLLVERGLEIGQILVVTYTRAATAELRDRIRRRLREALHAFDAARDGAPAARTGSDAGLIAALVTRSASSGSLARDHARVLAALRGFDEAAIFTIHGLCQRVLQDHAFESGVSFESELVGSPDALIAELAADFWTRALHAAPELLVRHVVETAAKDRRLDPDRLAALARRVVSQPDMPVLPESAAAADPSRLEQLCRERLLDLARIWACDRDEVIALLCDGDDLSRTQYRVKTIRTEWVPTLDGVLASGEPGLTRRHPLLEKLVPARLTAGTKKGRPTPAHTFFAACQLFVACDRELLEALDARVLDLELSFVRFAREELASRQQASGSQSYDDLLQRLAQALRGERGEAVAAGVRARFRVALVDEFQDTDPVQYEIFRRIWHEKGEGLFLIGDPKQAIYAFRGADVFAYMKAHRDGGGDALGLVTNWRAGPGLVRALNLLFGRVRAPFVFDEIPFQPVEAAAGVSDRLQDGRAGTAPLEILFVGRGPSEPGGKRSLREKKWAWENIPRAIASDIARLLASGARIDGHEVRAADVAVLCRTNVQAEWIREQLRALGIPGVVQTDASVFASDEAEDLERLLEALAEPGNVAALKAALATRLLGFVADDLFALDAGEDAWDGWIGNFHAWHDSWQRDGSVAALRHIIDELDVPARLLARGDGERRLTNLLHLAELLQGAVAEAGTGPLGLLTWLRRMRLDARGLADDARDEALIRLESDAQAVQIATVHRSKGLQYPIVYCPFLWDGRLLRDDDRRWVRFHDPDDDSRLKLDLGSSLRELNLQRAEREALAESLRLLYVAMTRARHRTVVVWGALKEAESSPLAYLLHQPPGDGARDPAEVAELTRKRFRELSDAELRADLEQLVGAGEGSVALRELDASAVSRRPPEPAGTGSLRARRALRSLSSAWRTSSFSGLVAASARGAAFQPGVPDRDAARASEEGRDYDARDPLEALEAVASEAAGDSGERVRLHDFPAGAGPGTLLHAIFERIDFSAPDAEEWRPGVAEALADHGLAARWLDPLCTAIGEILSTPLVDPAGAFSLSVIGRSRRLDELEFVLPVQAAHAGDLVTPARLADVFTRHAERPALRDYAERLRELAFPALEGHLKGFVDLVFERGGRFFVVDYKSNLLGPAPGDYALERLVEPMLGHHYVLQYHLYLVALHRHLQQRLPGYDYERHIAGVHYLFLRGMSPSYPPGSGIYHNRPPLALVQGLSDLFAGRTGEAA